MSCFEKPIKVTVSDPDTGREFESRIVANDYVLICAGNRYVKSVQMMGKPGRETHMVAIAVQPAGEKSQLSVTLPKTA